MGRGIHCAVLFVGVLFFANTASAQAQASEEVRTQYRALLRRGYQESTAGHYRAALQLYLQAQGMVNSMPADLLGLMAEVQITLGEYAAGHANAVECVLRAETAEGDPELDDTRTRCGRMLEALLQGRTGVLRVDTGFTSFVARLPPDTNPSTQVRIGSVQVPRSFWNRPFPVIPGHSTVQVDGNGIVPFRRAIEVRVGTTNTLAPSVTSDRRALPALDAEPASNSGLLEVRPPSPPPAGLAVSVRGNDLPPPWWFRPLPLPEGTAVVEALHPNGSRFARSVVIQRGERTTIDLDFSGSSAVQRRAPTIAPWVLVGLGGAIALASIPLAVVRQNALDTLDRACPMRVMCTTQGDLLATYERGQTSSLLVNVALAAGGVTLAVGLTWGIVSTINQRANTAQRSAIPRRF